MIISTDELRDVERLLRELRAFFSGQENGTSQPETIRFFAERPHLLLLLGFDEYRTTKAGLPEWERQLPDSEPNRESFYREAATGAWLWYEGSDKWIDRRHNFGVNGLFLFRDAAHSPEPFDIDQWHSTLRAAARDPDKVPRTLALSPLWTPLAQIRQEQKLLSIAPELIRAVAAETTSLEALTWRQLEEVIAELLRSHGLQINLTKRTRDGGRDIIARGELIPGEPLLLAIEVKKKPVVGIQDVQGALYANRDFPSLMIATSGRFSTGVLRERQTSPNAYRLFLKDGIALGRWINAYTNARSAV